MNVVKNRITIENCGKHNWILHWYTFNNGCTVNFQTYKFSTRAEAREKKNEIKECLM